MEMKKVKLSSKLIGGFLLMGLIIMIGGVWGPIGISRLSNPVKEVTEVQIPASYSLGLIQEALKSIRRLEQALLIPENFSDEQEKSRLLDELEGAWKKVDERRRAFESRSLSNEVSTLWKKTGPSWESWRKNHLEVVRNLNEGNRAGALTLSSGPGRESFHYCDNLLQEIGQVMKKQGEGFQHSGTDLVVQLKTMVLVGTLLGIFVTLIFGLFFSRSITRPIRRAIGKLSDTCAQFESTSGQIATVSHQLAAGTSSQAAAVEEASSVTADLSSIIQRNTDVVQSLQVISAESSTFGQAAFEFFRQSKKATKEITLSSEETSKIVKTIGEIAFQTNLLALSASVEAAQSSEVGIGFSVVAQEVRNLARRSTEAAKNTTSLIDETIRAINRGDNLVKASLGSFISYGEASTPINTFSGKAFEVAQKQAQGIEQINIALGEISHSAQSNAASAQEAASAAQEISAQAASMSKVVEELRRIVGYRIQ
ncbi:MAG: methyl-accepting chemotaxis protein [Thermodesulfobacteriota bacterium]